jgi:regulatory protein
MDPVSLKRRAIRMLAQREHSRTELRRKLLGRSRDEAEAARVDAMLDALVAEDWLSDRRFAETLVRSRALRHGGARIERELQEKGIDRDLAADLLAPLRGDEVERAFQLWQRRFASLPVDHAERGRHGRFLIQRGFSPSTVRRVFERALAVSRGEEPSGADSAAC